MKKKKIYYYKTYEDDLITSSNQEYELKENYEWIKSNIIYNIISTILYSIAKIFGYIYCKLFLNVKIENKSILKKYKKTGYFIYGNHTQPIGDVFIPAIICKSKRIYTIASPANLGIKIIGPLLPMLGILPTTKDIAQTKKLYNAVKQRIAEKKAVIIYPEAHVWEYYTKIRPFSETSFRFPAECKCPSFCITTTYYKRKIGKKPGIKVYIDGPFEINNELNKKENQEKIHNEIYECMQKRSKNSTYQYIEYKREKKI